MINDKGRNERSRRMSTTEATDDKGLVTDVVRESDRDLFEYRAEKLMRAGFSEDNALEIAMDLNIIDSDWAIKCLTCAQTALSGLESEYMAMYLLGLREDTF